MEVLKINVEQLCINYFEKKGIKKEEILDGKCRYVYYIFYNKLQKKLNLLKKLKKLYIENKKIIDRVIFKVFNNKNLEFLQLYKTGYI